MYYSAFSELRQARKVLENTDASVTVLPPSTFDLENGMHTTSLDSAIIYEHPA